ncbi:MAG: hypothetical protein R2771_00670 [Saprospiraceae bacterium]
MYKVIILPLANEDIKIATRWYEANKSGLGIRFIKEIRSKVVLFTHPLLVSSPTIHLTLNTKNYVKILVILPLIPYL